MEVAKIIKSMEKEDFRVLRAIERGMRRAATIKMSNICFFSKLKMEEVLFRLNKIHKNNLIIRDSTGETSYKLNSIGYDMLAFHILVGQGIISQLGVEIGKGKEADVYKCINDDNEEMTMKIFRIGRTSFRKVKQLRIFVGERRHFSWLYINRLAAMREYEALSKIAPLGLNIPKPIGINRHIIIMEFIEGTELNNLIDIEDPVFIFEDIINQISIIYKNVGIIHGDLGEFNVLINSDGDILIIDWPQWVPKSHPNGLSILKRDIENICLFFKKRFSVESNAEEILKSIIS